MKTSLFILTSLLFSISLLLNGQSNKNFDTYGQSFDILPGDKAIMARRNGSIDYESSDFQGNVGMSFDIGKGNTVEVGTGGLKFTKSIKRGGLLDKKRGWQNLIRGV